MCIRDSRRPDRGAAGPRHVAVDCGERAVCAVHGRDWLALHFWGCGAGGWHGPGSFTHLKVAGSDLGEDLGGPRTLKNKKNEQEMEGAKEA